jgi:hypothetical protein
MGDPSQPYAEQKKTNEIIIKNMHVQKIDVPQSIILSRSRRPNGISDHRRDERGHARKKSGARLRTGPAGLSLEAKPTRWHTHINKSLAFFPLFFVEGGGSLMPLSALKQVARKKHINTRCERLAVLKEGQYKVIHEGEWRSVHEHC